MGKQQSDGRAADPMVLAAATEMSLAERLAALSQPAQQDVLAALVADDWDRLLYDWWFWARTAQLPPPGDWFCWLILAGRGFGKTRSGAEWIRAHAEGITPLAAPEDAPARIALVAETWNDLRDVMVEGESGIMATARPDFRPKFESSKRRLVWPNGIMAHLYPAEDPDQLRGPQHHLAWCDEVAKWRLGAAVWANLLLGLRLGVQPRVCVTTTPRPIALIKSLIGQKTTVVTRGTTYDNRRNLAAGFFDQVVAHYEGTRLGRQELNAELLDDVPGALWSHGLLEQHRCRHAPALRRVVVGVDPPVTGGGQADACGIVVAGIDDDGYGYVVADRTLSGASPLEWARAVVKAYHEFNADRIVAEVNNGGDLVAAVSRQVDAGVSYRGVHASRSKQARAEPVAAFYERGMVRHCGFFAALEDQMCAFVAGVPWTGPGRSPDRVDALVWALTDVMMASHAAPRFRMM